MPSSTVLCKFLEAFASAHGRDEFMEKNEDRMLDFSMDLQGSAPLILILAEVKELKNKGNNLFRQNCFDSAADCYDEACKLLSLSLGKIEGEDIQSLSDLAVSLMSNMAACALKLEEYRAASGLCSMILDSFPRNVKALFRRAVASMKLKRFQKAELDLVQALMVEPSNKDVLRELEVVKGHLLIKENGKRVLEVAAEDCVDENKKKTVHVMASEVGLKDSESVVTEVMEEQSDVSIKDTESVDMEETEVQSICAIKSVLEFSKKGVGSSSLRIPAKCYEKLLEGRTVSFYRKRDLSTLTIRILKGETTMERDFIRERCYKKKKRKKKRRRGPKKENSKMMGAMNEDITPSDNIKEEPDISSGSLSASSTGAVTSYTSSICDNFIPHGTHIPQGNTRGVVNDSYGHVSLVNETASSICSSAQDDSNDCQPFVFSALPKKCNAPSFEKPSGVPFTSMLCRYPSTHHVHEKRKIAICEKNQSQGDESPRHNLSTFSKSRSLSHKFLRPRGVSVSCCRYSSEAQLIKKRKGMFVQLDCSDRPAKKLLLVVNIICSLLSYPNNVPTPSFSFLPRSFNNIVHGLACKAMTS